MGALSDPPTPAWALRAGRDGCSPWAVFAVGSVEHRLRWIAPGSFTMGSPSGELGRGDDETPRTVTLTQGYWLGETPVTQELWRAVMGTDPSRFVGDRRPVERVRWHDALAFCDALASRVPGLVTGLPTEAEWEHACRAGSATAHWNGDLSDAVHDPGLDALGWYRGNAGRETHDVASKAPNPRGLYDMLGNVWEWCADAWSDAPAVDVDPWVVRLEGTPRVHRGGCFLSDARDLRAAAREALSPGARDPSVGMRLAIGRSVRGG